MVVKRFTKNDVAITSFTLNIDEKAETLLNQEIYEIGKMDKCPSNMEEQLPLLLTVGPMITMGLVSGIMLLNNIFICNSIY